MHGTSGRVLKLRDQIKEGQIKGASTVNFQVEFTALPSGN
jgi:hypothetical protein